MAARAILPVVEDFQRQQEFLREFVLALAVISLRRQHLDGVVRIGDVAVIGLTAENGEHDARRHAEFPLDRGERAAILRIKLAALHREPLDHRLF